MSDGAESIRTPTRQAKTQRKGAPRGGRHGLSRPTVLPPQEIDSIIEFAPVASPPRRRRVTTARVPPAPALSRAAEMAYVRADMRKLLGIASGLLALMVVILVFANR